MTGKLTVPTVLTVLTGSKKSEVFFAKAGDKLQSRFVKLLPGSTVVAALATPAKKAITVRFTGK